MKGASGDAQLTQERAASLHSGLQALDPYLGSFEHT